MTSLEFESGTDFGTEADDLCALAYSLSIEGRITDAQQIYVKALHTAERESGYNSAAVATILYDLGVFYFYQNEFGKAKIALGRLLHYYSQERQICKPYVLKNIDCVKTMLRILNRKIAA